MTEPDPADLMTPPNGPVLEVHAVPDETGNPDTIGAAYLWQIVTESTHAILVFGERCPTEDEARAAGKAALSSYS